MEDINETSGQIEVRGPHGSVFLYTENTVHELVNIVHDVISEKQNWYDPDYLTRMLFLRMVSSKKETSTFGIGTQMYIDIRMLVTVDIILQQVVITEFDFETGDSITRGMRYSFKAFVEDFMRDAEL